MAMAAARSIPMSLFGAVRLLLVAWAAPRPARVGSGSLPPIRAGAWAAWRPGPAVVEDIVTTEGARFVEIAAPCDGIHVVTMAVSPVVRLAGHSRLADAGMPRSRPAG
jgi:hypothetical protein